MQPDCHHRVAEHINAQRKQSRTQHIIHNTSLDRCYLLFCRLGANAPYHTIVREPKHICISSALRLVFPKATVPGGVAGALAQVDGRDSLVRTTTHGDHPAAATDSAGCCHRSFGAIVYFYAFDEVEE